MPNQILAKYLRHMILITKYLNLNWNIVIKFYFFIKIMIDFK